MSRFLRDNNAYSIQPPLEYRDVLEDLTMLRSKLAGSLLMPTQVASNSTSPDFTFPTSCTRHVFKDGVSEILMQ